MKGNLATVPVQSAISGKGVSTGQERINRQVTSELVIALCGPLGTPLHQVARLFKRLLEDQYKYTKVEIIRLSTIIRKIGQIADDEQSLTALIDAGNEIRRTRGNKVLAVEAIRLINASRSSVTEFATGDLFEPETPSSKAIIPTPVLRQCHIIDSIKNIQELILLRSIYGDMLHVIGVYTPIELRIENLGKRIGGQDVIHKLIDRDSGEEISNGQNVSTTFPKADFFIRADRGTDSELRAPIQRFLDLMLNARIITPTKLERAMYAAYSAARNSACLSRQVGASITGSDGNVIAVGWNDVPKPFGGLYEFDNLDGKEDHRCWNKEGGKCFNDFEKDAIASTIADLLIENKLLDEKDKNEAAKTIRTNQKLKGLIEFSRAVHAEMHALLNAGTEHGNKIKGGQMFVTTYPCHACARHIIASGIKEIYFLEPYRKSMATKLHPDAITESEQDHEKVRLLPFHGVAPSRFLKLFSAPDNGRKDSVTGRMIEPLPFPVTARNLEAVTTLEKIAISELKSLAVIGKEIAPNNADAKL